MAIRSVRASKQAIKKADEVLKRKGWKRKDLEKVAGLSNQPISFFFNGKPVDLATVDKIYSALGLRHEDGDIEPDPDEQDQDNSTNIDTLVQQVRSLRRAKIQEQCGKMRMLDIKPLRKAQTLSEASFSLIALDLCTASVLTRQSAF